MNAPRPRLTNEAYLTRLIRDNKYIADRGNYRNVKAFIIPTECKKMRLVPVAVRTSFSKKLRPIDVMFRNYVSMMIDPSSLSFNLDEYMTMVDRYPRDSPVPGPYGYTIFTSNHAFEKLNKLLPTFSGAGQLEIRGNILVVKHDRESGSLVSFESSECYFAQRLVVDTFLSVAGQTPFFPPESFPLNFPLETGSADADPAEPIISDAEPTVVDPEDRGEEEMAT